MEKIILKDNTSFEIMDGGSLGSITAVVTDFITLGVVANALVKQGNLDSVTFATGDVLTGAYEDMTMDAPLFKAVDIVSNVVHATFAIRAKTATELRLDALESGQAVQDGAIGDLGTVVSEIAEGGTV